MPNRPAASEPARGTFRNQFAEGSGAGIEMAIRSAGALADAEEIAASREALANDLLEALASIHRK